MTQQSDILALTHEQGVQFIDLWFTDIMGIVKNVTMPVSMLPSILEQGVHVDGSTLEGFARRAESDKRLIPDLNTVAILPWDTAENRTARLICSMHNLIGDPFGGDPRHALRRVLAQAAEMGYRFKTGLELEFFLFKLDANEAPILPIDRASYFDLPPNAMRPVLHDMMKTLNELGIAVDSLHHEIGSGQYEVDLGYDDALTSADKMLTARVALKAVAQRHGMHCTFMPRPDMNLPGSGMHTHQSLHDIHSDYNVFSDPADRYGLSPTAKHFLAGQLSHARAMCAILSPLVNSYKRLRTSFEAPTRVTWAQVNRAALIRVPHVLPGKEAHTRLELRCPDPSCNPYLATAVMLATGLEGLREQLVLPEPLEEALPANERQPRHRQIEELPASLAEALVAFQDDEVMNSALGLYISDRYSDAKHQEMEEYNRQVTRWEVERYIMQY